jgi:hypothetical protein
LLLLLLLLLLSYSLLFYHLSYSHQDLRTVDQFFRTP